MSKTNTTHTTAVAPATLIHHPDLERIRMMEACASYMAANAGSDEARQDAAVDLLQDWEAFVSDIREHGILEPIKVLEGSLFVVDGRHRLAAAREAGMDAVPIAYVTQAEADAIIDGSVIGRRNWTKSQKAYFAVLRHPEALEVKPGGDRQTKKHSAQNAECFSVAELAAKYGVSQRLIAQAKDLYRGLADKPKLRERLEISLWSGMSLGGCLSGLGGAKATKDRPKGASDNCTAARSLKSLRAQLKGFGEWDAVNRDRFADDFKNVWRDLDSDARSLMLDLIEEVAKERGVRP